MIKTAILIFQLQFFSIFAYSHVSNDSLNQEDLIQSKLNQILSDVQSDPEYNNSYIYNGCFVRAHYLAFLIQKNGIAVKKVLLQPENQDEFISFPHSNPTKRPAHWRYHMVAAVQFPTRLYILDTTVSSRVLTLESWLSHIKAISPNQNIRLGWKLLPVTEYTPDVEYNNEFKSLGSPFSEQAMDQISYDMEGLFNAEAAESAPESEILGLVNQ